MPQTGCAVPGSACMGNVLADPPGPDAGIRILAGSFGMRFTAWGLSSAANLVVILS